MKRVSLFVLLLFVNVISLADEPVKIGLRRELFVDDTLVERLAGRAELRLHPPMPREVALETNEAWEGNSTTYVTVLQDGDKYRMYYRGSHFSYLGRKDRPSTRDVYCYAESSDGGRWTKPELGLLEWNGSKKNNIVWDCVGSHAFVFAQRARRPAGIVNFASLYGVRSPKHFLYDGPSKDIGYTITKHGVIGLTRHLATFLAPDVRVNCLVPGGVEH